VAVIAPSPVEPVLEERPTEWLEAEVRTLAGHIAAATCRWLLMIGELDRRGAWESWECRSMAHWLTWHCSVSMRTASDHVRVARALEHLPIIRATFARGELSYSKVRALTRAATPETESDLVEMALQMTGAQLDQVVAGYCGVEQQVNLDRAETQLARRGVFVEHQDDGSVSIRISAPPEIASLLLDALEDRMDDVPRDEEARDPIAARRLDALSLLLVDLVAPEGRAPRTELVVHADVQVITEREAGRCETEQGVGLCAATAERLACDGGLRLVLEDETRVLGVGRKSRKIPVALRRAVLESARRHCQFPGCHSRRGLQIHHVRHWLHGGETEYENLVALCWFHHRSVHDGGCDLRLDRDRTIVVVDRRGRVLRSDPPATGEGEADAIVSMHQGADMVIDDTTVKARWGAGERFDRRYAVDALAQHLN
jgi:hypothetical protein